MFSRGRQGGFPGWHGTSPYPVRLGWLGLSAMGQEVLGARTWGVSGRWTSGACRPAVLTLPGFTRSSPVTRGLPVPFARSSRVTRGSPVPFSRSLSGSLGSTVPLFPQSLKVPGVHHSPFPQFHQLPWGSTTSPPNSMEPVASWVSCDGGRRSTALRPSPLGLGSYASGRPANATSSQWAIGHQRSTA